MNNPNYVGPDIAKKMHDVLSKAVYSLEGIKPIPRSAPIERTEYPKCVGTHIWELAPGIFDFTDETENFSGGQYKSVEAAQAAMDEYCYWLDLQPILCLLR